MQALFKKDKSRGCERERLLAEFGDKYFQNKLGHSHFAKRTQHNLLKVLDGPLFALKLFTETAKIHSAYVQQVRQSTKNFSGPRSFWVFQETHARSLALSSLTGFKVFSSSSQSVRFLHFPRNVCSSQVLATSYTAAECPRFSITFGGYPGGILTIIHL